jgi:putative intracellular protease/amidase
MSRMATILVPLPSQDFDPTESAVPWRILTGRGHRVVFATPDGRPGRADARMVTGVGLSVLAPILRADANGRSAYTAMAENREFLTPMAYDAIDSVSADALLLPGGHAAGMRPYLESAMLQSVVARFFAEDRPVAAICHGVLLAARSRRPDCRSVLHGRRTTCLLKIQEMMAWAITRLWLGNYYRTYPTPVEDEVRAVLAKPGDFEAGPTAVRRDSLARPDLGFVVRDGNYLSGRWPGDAHRLGLAFAEMLGAP